MDSVTPVSNNKLLKDNFPEIYAEYKQAKIFDNFLSDSGLFLKRQSNKYENKLKEEDHLNLQDRMINSSNYEDSIVNDYSYQYDPQDTFKKFLLGQLELELSCLRQSNYAARSTEKRYVRAVIKTYYFPDLPLTGLWKAGTAFSQELENQGPALVRHADEILHKLKEKGIEVLENLENVANGYSDKPWKKIRKQSQVLAKYLRREKVTSVLTVDKYLHQIGENLQLLSEGNRQAAALLDLYNTPAPGN